MLLWKGERKVEYSSLFVVVLGLATTFVGLICIIYLAKIMSLLCRLIGKKENADAKQQTGNPKAAVQNNDIPNRGEFVAAISAAIAEDMGTDISSIRILSIKKV